MDCSTPGFPVLYYTSWSLLKLMSIELMLSNHLSLHIWKASSLEKTRMLGRTEGRRWRGKQRLRWLDGIDSMDMSLSKLQEPNCRKELDMTGRLNNNNIIKYGCWDMSLSKLRELVMNREALAHWLAMPWVTKSSVPDPGVLYILLGHLAKF